MNDISLETLARDFYLRDTREVARSLLGKELVRVHPEGTTSGIIVETEAYMGMNDQASHAFGGRRSPRTSIMFREGGFAYVYLIYGMYWCLNLTTGEAGRPECVLIRALEPMTGIELMRLRRKAEGRRSCTLTNGPGKLCAALAIDRSLYGADLCGNILFVREGVPAPGAEIVAAKRVNIDYAGEAAHHEWRYYLKDNACVSRL